MTGFDLTVLRAALLRPPDCTAAATSTDLARVRRRLWPRLHRELGPSAVPRAPDTRGLAEALRAGDASAFDLLLERHGTALLGYAQGWLQPADAENAMQDAWLELVQKRARIPADDSALRPFLFGFVRNHVRRCLQSRLTFEPLPPDIADDGDADLVILARERRELLLQAMLALDPLQQDVILATLDGNRPGAIADQLDLAAGHVRVLKHRALAILRARLGGA